MCQSAAEGGRRCAAHTRPGFTRALGVFGCEPDGSKRAALVAEHKAAIIDHALTPKGKVEVEEAIARIESVYEANPSRTAVEETGRAEYVYALKLAQMQASLRGELEEAARRREAYMRTGSHGGVTPLVECETGAVSVNHGAPPVSREQAAARLRPMSEAERASITVHRHDDTRQQRAAGQTNVHNDALAQRWFEQSAQALAQGRYVTPRSGGANAETTVHLELQTYTSHTREHGTQQRTAVTNRLLGPSPTTCGKPGHSASMTKTPVQGSSFTDCACDAACTHCGAREGASCTTTDGGGMSGGGYTTRSHAKRIKASARIQSLKDGTRSRCDLGDHQWTLAADGATATCTGTCGRTEPVHPSSSRLNRLAGSGQQ